MGQKAGLVQACYLCGILCWYRQCCMCKGYAGTLGGLHALATKATRIPPGIQPDLTGLGSKGTPPATLGLQSVLSKYTTMHNRVPWWCWLQVRTKVFKCLGAVVEADSRVMASAEVAAAVQAAQEDDSAAVKEAVLELLVRLININPQLAGEYFETLRQASYVSHCPLLRRAVPVLCRLFQFITLDCSMRCVDMLTCVSRAVISSPVIAGRLLRAPQCLLCCQELPVLHLPCLLLLPTPPSRPIWLQDPGIMVRKRAIRALWECCSCPGFSRAGDAVVAVLQRAYDKEDSMRTLVTKICGEMWFTDASSFAGAGPPSCLV